MKNLKRLSLLLVLVLLLAACTGGGEEVETEEVEETEAVEEVEEVEEEEVLAEGEITLSTTTSTEDSGLLDAILPDFTEKTGLEVKVVAVGTGAALQNGRDGNADVLLVHAKASEEEFVEEGYGKERFDVMYNDFIIVGPEADPVGIGVDFADDVAGALLEIKDNEAKFVSRGDDSGTHKKELQLWEAADIEDPAEDVENQNWYVSAGQGMGDVLTMTSEQEAYTMTDRATYLAMKDDLDLVILVEGDEELFNQYGVIAVVDAQNEEGADAFVEWILSEEVQNLISEFGVEEFGQALFVPNAE